MLLHAQHGKCPIGLLIDVMELIGVSVGIEWRLSLLHALQIRQTFLIDSGKVYVLDQSGFTTNLCGLEPSIFVDAVLLNALELLDHVERILGFALDCRRLTHG